MMIEAQAKTKWCPHVRHSLNEDEVREVNNRVGDIVEFGICNEKFLWNKCCGSMCMAWRWGGYRKVPSATVPNQDEAHGYCGAFGRPES